MREEEVSSVLTDKDLWYELQWHITDANIQMAYKIIAIYGLNGWAKIKQTLNVI